MVLTLERGGSLYTYHRNVLGSITEITNESGSLVERYEYDVYGSPKFFDSSDTPLDASAIENPYLFTGRRYDPESGNYYYRARMYSPAVGRFLQMDPLGYVDGLNLYAYVGNNPVNWLDPKGLRMYIGGPNPGQPLTYEDIAARSKELRIYLNFLPDWLLDWILPDDPADIAMEFMLGGPLTDMVCPLVMTGGKELGKKVLKEVGEEILEEALEQAGKEALEQAGKEALEQLGKEGLEEAGKEALEKIPQISQKVINQANHIFGPKSISKHNLQGVLDFFNGNKVTAFNAIQDAAQKLANKGAIKGIFETVVQVGGQTVTVRGAIVDGVVNVGTAFIP